jgi:hypothetical protein
MDDYCRPFRASNGATPQVDKFHRGGLLKRKFHIMLTEALQLGPVKVMEVLPLIASTDVSYRSGDTLSPLRKNRNRLTTYEGNKPDSLCSCATIWNQRLYNTVQGFEKIAESYLTIAMHFRLNAFV